MLKLFTLISITLIIFILLALSMKGTDFSQAILGSLYYFPIIVYHKLGITGVTTGDSCSLFGSCVATPLGWILIALLWIAIIFILSGLLSTAINHIKNARNIS
jgi:hypothetical protein